MFPYIVLFLAALKMKRNFLSILRITRLLFIFKIYSGRILILYLLYFLCFAEALGKRTTYRKRCRFRKVYGLLLSLALHLKYVALCLLLRMNVLI